MRRSPSAVCRSLRADFSERSRGCAARHLLGRSIRKRVTRFERMRVVQRRSLVGCLAPLAVLAGAGAVLVGCGGGGDEPAAGGVQSEILLYRNPVHGLPGTVSAAGWAWPGDALSASVMPLRGDLLTARLRYARWVLTWNPCTLDPAFPTGTRLVSADHGPSNLSEIARIRSPEDQPCTNPRVDAVEITGALNEILDAKILKQIGQQTFGNEANGCLIYASWIEMLWA